MGTVNIVDVVRIPHMIFLRPAMIPLSLNPTPKALCNRFCATRDLDIERASQTVHVECTQSSCFAFSSSVRFRNRGFTVFHKEPSSDTFRFCPRVDRVPRTTNSPRTRTRRDIVFMSINHVSKIQSVYPRFLSDFYPLPLEVVSSTVLLRSQLLYDNENGMKNKTYSCFM